MAHAGGHVGREGARHVKGAAIWVIVMMAVSCGFPELSRLPGVEPDAAPADMATVDMEVRPGPRCMGLASTCGPGANESCCQAAMVPGGTFNRSDDPSYPATVSTFVLDRYEVTVGRFRAFVEAGMGVRASPPAAGAGEHPKIPGSGWSLNWYLNLAIDRATLLSALKCSSTRQNWTDTPGANEDKPMNCMTWYEAMAFCIWDGGRLPTEAEWNYAASGGNEQRAYPWSSPPSSTSIDCTYANYKRDVPAGTYCVNGTTGATNRVGSESPKGDGRWGHSDLAGNLFELIFDWYSSTYPLPCNDCAVLTQATPRALRGGSFDSVGSSLFAADRYGVTPTVRSDNLGMRCARNP